MCSVLGAIPEGTGRLFQYDGIRRSKLERYTQKNVVNPDFFITSRCRRVAFLESRGEGQRRVARKCDGGSGMNP